MSLIKSIRNQLGLSVTPANNFTLTAEADNGTMKLARGNAGATTQDIMTVGANGYTKFPQTNIDPTACSGGCSSETGTLSSATWTGTYIKTGKLVTLNFSLTITNAGTASGGLILANLPVNSVGDVSFGCGRETASTGFMCQITNLGSLTLNILKYDNTTIIATGRVVKGSITYQVA